ncbi:MAG: bifunctional nicotinamidase/pyrazinamidase [Anaerosomatales bacterium]|nr:bifunctional nicotinamidase/pyrazinamidase [Anaerosomatales bacterium]
MDALLLVDVQNDFMPFGALPVADGDAVVPVANALARRFELVVATQDWHPADHGSFAVNHPGTEPGEMIELGGVPQVLWPPHCVQDSPGASFHSALDIGPISHVVHKGTDPRIDSYSGFFDNGHLKATGLEGFLRERGVKRVVLLGLATDYCVKFTALDGVALGFEVTVVADGCRGVELEPGDSRRAFDEMAAAGCRVVTSADLGQAGPAGSG